MQCCRVPHTVPWYLSYATTCTEQQLHFTIIIIIITITLCHSIDFVISPCVNSMLTTECPESPSTTDCHVCSPWYQSYATMCIKQQQRHRRQQHGRRQRPPLLRRLTRRLLSGCTRRLRKLPGRCAVSDVMFPCHYVIPEIKYAISRCTGLHQT